MKGKPLLPTLKTKKRYVHYMVYCDHKLSHRDICKVLESTFLEWFGKVEFAKADFRPVKALGKNEGIIKVNANSLNRMHYCMAMTRKIKDHDVLVTAIQVSGILKKIGG